MSKLCRLIASDYLEELGGGDLDPIRSLGRKGEMAHSEAWKLDPSPENVSDIATVLHPQLHRMLYPEALTSQRMTFTGTVEWIS